jgi:ABC-type amino acid transport system permease subunit
MMTGDEYKAALEALQLTQTQAAKALGVSHRTSQRYATHGAPRAIALALEALAAQRKLAA